MSPIVMRNIKTEKVLKDKKKRSQAIRVKNLIYWSSFSIIAIALYTFTGLSLMFDFILGLLIVLQLIAIYSINFLMIKMIKKNKLKWNIILLLFIINILLLNFILDYRILFTISWTTITLINIWYYY